MLFWNMLLGFPHHHPQGGIIMIKDEQKVPEKILCDILNFTGYTVVLHKKNSWLETEKGKVCQRPLSSCTPKQIPVSFSQDQLAHTGSNQSGRLMKWKQIVAPYSTSRAPAAARACFDLICWFFCIHTVSFNPGLLNWHGKGKSLRAAGQILDVGLRSH